MWDTKSEDFEVTNPKRTLDVYNCNKQTKLRMMVFISNIIIKIKHLKEKGIVDDYESIFKEDNLKIMFKEIISLSLYTPSRLTLDERKARFDILEKGLVNKDFLPNSELEQPELYKEFVEHIRKYLVKDFNDLRNDYLGKSKHCFMNSVCDKDKKDILCLFGRILNYKGLDELIISSYKIEFSKWNDRVMEDFEFENDEIFLLDFSADISDIISTGDFFKIEKYNISSRSMNVNGERIEFSNESNPKGSSRVFINNSLYGKYSIYTPKNTFFCFNYEEALELGKSKMKDLKDCLNKFEEVVF